MAADKPLTRSEITSLGGLATAFKLGVDGRKLRASRGGIAVLETRGPAYFKKLAYARWGRLPREEKRPVRGRTLQEGADAAGNPST